MYVIFEGLDKTGKTTLMNIINRKTSYQDILRDRGACGWIAFDEIYKRSTPDRRKSYELDALQFRNSNDYLVVYCRVPWEIACQRLKDHNELEQHDYNYEKAQKIYDKCVSICYDKNSVITLDTSKHSISECTDIILRRIEEEHEKIDNRINEDAGKIFEGIKEKSIQFIDEPERKFTREQLDKYIDENWDEESELAIVASSKNKKYCEILLLDPPFYKLTFEYNSENKTYLCKIFCVPEPFNTHDDFEDTIEFYVIDNKICGMDTDYNLSICTYLQVLDSLLYYHNIEGIQIVKEAVTEKEYIFELE